MSEIVKRVQQVTSSVEKAVGEHAARIEAAVAEVGKLQTEGLDQAAVFVENSFRMAKEQVAFAVQIAGEWRKLVIAATRSAAGVFASKKA